MDATKLLLGEPDPGEGGGIYKKASENIKNQYSAF
jgi:hypothetical protein